MGKKRLGAVAICAAAMMGVGAGAAFGGEVTGQGGSLKVTDGKWATGLHARSLCVFRQEDDQFKAGGSKGEPAHSQSWGQIARNVQGAAGGVPGSPTLGPDGDGSCRGSLIGPAA